MEGEVGVGAAGEADGKGMLDQMNKINGVLEPSLLPSQ